jgi:hypothetical protein
MKTELEIKFDGDTVWLTQNQIALLFKGSRANIVEHIQNIYKTAELDEVSTCRKFRQVRKEGKQTVERQIDHYNLDVIISVGATARLFSVVQTEAKKKSLKKDKVC